MFSLASRISPYVFFFFSRFSDLSVHYGQLTYLPEHSILNQFYNVVIEKVWQGIT